MSTPSPRFHILLARRLQTGGLEAGEARAVARVLLEEVGGVTLTDLCARQADDALPAAVQARLLALADRVAAGEPVQYAVGAARFCGLRLEVSPDVLIPRPETEQLVEDIVGTDLPRLAPATAAPRLLDIGTGSGCIALALKQACPAAEAEGWDISAPALAVARANAERLGLDVTFRQRDILAPEAEAEATALPPFDLVVSNPPYVCQREAAGMEPRVLRHEPHLALFVPDADPLRFYRAIARAAHTLLRPGGLLRLEINRAFGPEMRQLLRDEGYASIEIKNDLYGNTRFAYATWNP